MRRDKAVATTGDDARVRAALGLPVVPDTTNVMLVSQEAVCKKARDAFIAKASPAAAVPPVGRVYRVAVGNKFAVVDPVYRYASTNVMTVQIEDSRYRWVSLF